MPSVQEQTASSPEKFPLRGLVTAVTIISILAGCGQDPMSAGTEHMKKAEYTSAVIEFKNAVQAKPESLEARLALADALERTYDSIGAEQNLRKAINLGGDADFITPRIALLMLDRGEGEKVVQQFKDLRLKSPAGESSLRGAVAIAYVSQKRFSLAEEHLKGSTVSTPSTLLAKAQILLAKGEKEKALAELTSVASAPDTPWWILRALSRIYAASGKPTQASEAIKRAHDLAPWHRGLMGEYGESLLLAGKLDQAIPIRDKLKRTAPDYFWTHYVNALVLANEGRTEDSLAAALKVLKVSPEHLPATLLVASAELQKGEVLMANSRLEKITLQHPYSVPTLKLLGQSYLRLGKLNEAEDVIRRGLSVAPTDPQLLSLKADTEMSRGSTEKAAGTLEELIALYPQDAQNLLRLSELQVRRGNAGSATKLLDRATEIGKNDPRTVEQIIAVALRMGDTNRIRDLADYAIKSRPQDPQSHLALAAALGIQKDTDGAWRAALAALELKPDFQPALSALGLVANDPEKRRELLSRYEKAVLAKASSPQIYLEYARLLGRAEGDRAAIISTLEKGLSILPSSVSLREALVEELMRAGKQDSALSVAQSGAAVPNALPTADALLANTYERIGKTNQATETYRKLATNYPQRADWRFKLATLEAEAGRKKEATTLFRALITERPLDPANYISLAFLTLPDNPKEAFSIAKALGEREPNKLTGMLLEGDLLVKSGKLDEALKQFSKAVKAGATPAAQLRTIDLLDRTNRSTTADQELTDVLARFPNDLAVSGFAAQRYLKRGNPDRAVEILQRIAAKNPGNAILLNDLAWAQIQAKQPEVALTNASKAVAQMPNNANALDTLGMAQALAGMQQEAIATLRIATNLAPRAADPRLHLAEQLLNSGDKKNAAANLNLLEKGQLTTQQEATAAALRKSIGI